jgi:hypothetical protein
MKTFIKVLIHVALLITALLLGGNSLQAQGEQLERDIRIAERILEEIFTPPAAGQAIVFSPTSRVEGEYIPGVGVHFKIAGNPGGVVLIRTQDGEQRQEQEITENWVETRMIEYLTGYAGQLRDLPAGEQVRITFGSRPSQLRTIFVGGSPGPAQLPGLSMWVNKAEIDRLTRGNITEAQFRNRISRHALEETQELRDMNIFASVLETSLSSSGIEHLRVTRKPRYEYLPGLGVHFHINATTRSHPALSYVLGSPDDVTYIQAPRVEFNNDSLRLSITRLHDSLRVHTENLRVHAEELRKQAEEARRQGEQIRRQIEVRVAERDTLDLSADVARLTDEVKTVIKEYGTTLSSLNDGELLMITINWPARNPTVPERTYIRISKEDLVRGRDPNIEEIGRK